MKITTLEKTISVESPYNSEFVDGARNLAGKFSAGAWHFDIRDEKDVRDLCMRAYGTDGKRVNQCDIEITFKDDYFASKSPIILFGISVARAFGRDSGAKLGYSVKVVSGKFDSAGSMKNWGTSCDEGTVIVLRDVSKYLVDTCTDPKLDIKIVSVNSNLEKSQEEELLIELNALWSREDEILRRLGKLDESKLAERRAQRLKDFEHDKDWVKNFQAQAEANDMKIHAELRIGLA